MPIGQQIDWREWVVNGTADCERLEDLKEVARKFGERLAREREEEIMERIAKK